MHHSGAPWDDELGPYQKATQVLEETLEASRSLDKFLTAAVESGMAMEEPKIQNGRTAMSSKLTSLVDIVESGIKELEDHADALMPRFQAAHAKGRENMVKMQGHIERAEAAVQKIEEFNKRAEGSNT